MFRRHQSQSINTTVMLNNRTADFLHAPSHTFDLIVKRNADISGNVKIGGDLTVGGDINAVNFRATGNFYLDNYVLIPAGTIIMSAINFTPSGGSLTRIPDGWLECAGQLLLRNDYSALFAVIGTTYDGSGVNSSYFTLPNLKGRVPVGYDNGNGDYATMGNTGGEATHTLTTNEIPNHTHALTRRSNSDNGAFDTSDAHASESSACTTDRNNLGLFQTQAIGGGAAHNNMQPYIVVTYLIKF